ncbi:uncharacterized protein PGTG_00571 [Puccinia graminis f. sp. tritici CRL 75-36-700-3]|uniref:Uncharacterized protein n=1 Tax=Puccinia graminis f. sp. tritici (strain CRL 75-36-700-3 / race SCCL) TaxID=418459 RepID=E3JRI6_PUCGT|nr:uncharacterized protein PGTG_00571 [Puccinia graminis f. sp. tritici CRL 75-36-700-3]EFP74615.2 hypothetical protein PGTG_00571 [Puccinia graminis f. sp. tritici CRL 75-36-700-3]
MSLSHLLCFLLWLQLTIACLYPEDDWLAAFAERLAADIEVDSSGNLDQSFTYEEGTHLKRARPSDIYDCNELNPSCPEALSGCMQEFHPIIIPSDQPTQGSGSPQPKRACKDQSILLQKLPHNHHETAKGIGFWTDIKILSANELNDAFQKMLNIDRPRRGVSTLSGVFGLLRSELKASLNTNQDEEYGHVANQYQKYYQETINDIYLETQFLPVGTESLKIDIIGTPFEFDGGKIWTRNVSAEF